ESRYVPPAEKKAAIGGKRPTEMVIQRTLPSGRKMTYRVIDSTSRMRSKDWAACVCVLVQGQAWQFKGWQWAVPVTLFQHVLGVHMKFDDVKVDEKVANWNVRVLEVRFLKQNLD
ncbi:unnamed protein product, partial [Choristocarpus tenellus]